VQEIDAEGTGDIIGAVAEVAIRHRSAGVLHDGRAA
jgi:hypothetical protein